MLTQFKNLSSWREDNITIKAKETYTLDFLDTNPNMFVVINPNLAVLKISIGSLPLENHYEFKVDYNTTETLGRPTGTAKLYILNDSDLQINVKVFSIHDTFNLQILKNMNVNLEDYTIETNTKIGGVKEGVELPVKMDSVQFLDIKDLLTSIKDNKVSLTTVQNLLTAIRDKNTDLSGVISLLTDIKNKEINVSGGAGNVEKENIEYGNNTAVNGEYQAYSKCIYHFEWFFNDGDDITIYKKSGDVRTDLLTIKTNEAFTDFDIELEAYDFLGFECSGYNNVSRRKWWVEYV